MKDTVIFDMDGVLFDSEPMYIKEIIEFFSLHNIVLDQKEVSKIVGVDDKTYNQLLIDWWNHTSSEEDLFRKYDIYDESIKRDYTKIINPDILPLLKYLKKHHYKIALASNSHKELIELALCQTGLYTYFDVITSGEQFEHSKPDPTIYLYTVHTLKSSKENCLIIEDSMPGIQAARNANIDVLALKDTRYHIDQSQATIIIDNLMKVIEYLETSNN